MSYASMWLKISYENPTRPKMKQGLILTLTDRLQSEGFNITTADDGENGFESALAKNST